MGIAARKIFEEKYTAEMNYEQLMSIYNRIIIGQRDFESNIDSG